ncbi:MAG: RDD family protein [Wenzhouxiangella sp.]
MGYCALPRRVAAIVYDSLLIVALWMAATAAVVLLRQSEIEPSSLAFQLYLLAVAWLYLAICWRSGQTLGMKAWRIRLVGNTQPIAWSTTVIRFVVAMVSLAAFAIGFLWSLFHDQRATWHDLASDTRLIVTPRSKSKPAQVDDAKQHDHKRRQQQ